MDLEKKLKSFLLVWLLFILILSPSPTSSQRAIKPTTKMDDAPKENKSTNNSEIMVAISSVDSQSKISNGSLPDKKLPMEEEKTNQVTDQISASPKPVTPTPFIANGQIQVEESKYKSRVYQQTVDDFPESFKTSFYFFVGLSTVALLLILFKVHRLRLSRAERKYGVQGDRAAQELTPLPVSIEDGNSDDDDQTLFEINREQIRIL